MNYNKEQIDEAALALLYLNHFNDSHGVRAWKSMNWNVLARLEEKGLVLNSKSKSKSLFFTEAGLKKAKEALESKFNMPE